MWLGLLKIGQILYDLGLLGQGHSQGQRSAGGDLCITQKVMDGFWWNFQDRSDMAWLRTDELFVDLDIWVKVTTKVIRKEWTDFVQIYRNGCEWANLSLVRFWMTLGDGVQVTSKVKCRQARICAQPRSNVKRRRFALRGVLKSSFFYFSTNQYYCRTNTVLYGHN